MSWYRQSKYSKEGGEVEGFKLFIVLLATFLGAVVGFWDDRKAPSDPIKASSIFIGAFVGALLGALIILLASRI